MNATLTKSKVDLSRMTPKAVKEYQAGCREVEKKLAGHRKPTQKQLEAQTITQGRAIIAHKLGAAGYKKMFGTLPPAPAPKAPARPAPAPAGRKTYSTPGPRTRHRYATAGLFA